MKYDIKSLTLDEKLHLLTGKNKWLLQNANGKLKDVFLSDGPNGLRKINIEDNSTYKTTAMPNIHLLANTWNTELAFLDGATIADDCIEYGADVLLAPGVNIKRTPLCGRNFEYFAEDPFLAGYMAKAYIEGVQSKGIGTSLKHYCANNREYDRLFQSNDVDERTLREIYLPAFEIAVTAKPWTVMCAYNPVCGVHASENEYLLKSVLREEFGFDGVIVSDWNAVKHSARAVKATLDLRMPYNENAVNELKAGLESGYITQEDIDERVQKLLTLIEKTENDKKQITTTKAERHQNAVTIASEGIVLLKNEGGILPLASGKTLVGGPYAKEPCLGGGGSAYAISEYKVKPLAEELQARLGERAEVIPSPIWMTKDYVSHIKAVYKAAYGVDSVVLVVGTGQDECEGLDRTHLRLTPLQEDLIINTAKVNPNVIVVVNMGSAVDMSAWIDKVKAVVLLGFAGEGAFEALADILCGKVCPSGKLAETFPLCLEDTPCGTERGNGFYESYDEGIFVGYRYYDKQQKEVLFPFGYGLSYAEFAYSNLQIQKKSETDYDVRFTVTNLSSVAGKEVVQLYVNDVFTMVPRPEKELKGFAKIALKAGESKEVCLSLNARSFAYYNTMLRRWHVENGAYKILVGASSRDIRLQGEITINCPFETQQSLE